MTYTYYHIVHGDGIGKKILHIPSSGKSPRPPPSQKLNGQHLLKNVWKRIVQIIIAVSSYILPTQL